MNSTLLRYVMMVSFLSLMYTTTLQQGFHGCNLEEDVVLEQTFLGIGDDNFQVYGVTITNGCPCKLVDLLLSCDPDFRPHSIDPVGILTQNANTCKVNREVEPAKSVNFVYTGDKKWPKLEVVLIGCMG